MAVGDLAFYYTLYLCFICQKKKRGGGNFRNDFSLALAPAIFVNGREEPIWFCEVYILFTRNCGKIGILSGLGFF